MNDAIRRMLGSTKFWTMMIGLVTTFGATAFARWGIEVSDAAVAQIAITVSAMFGILLHAQGNADHGKEAAKIEASTKTTTTVEPDKVVEEKKVAEVPL